MKDYIKLIIIPTVYTLFTVIIFSILSQINIEAKEYAIMSIILSIVLLIALMTLIVMTLIQNKKEKKSEV